MSLLLGQPTFAQATENQQMAFEGTLTDVNGNPISLSGVTLNFYISANGCYLYGESSTTAGDSQGQISHRFGNGTVLMGSPNAFSQNLFFGNVAGTTTFAGNNCSVTAADTRLAQVYYQSQNITATIKLGTVPYAQNATMFGGKAPTDFIQTNADTYTLFTGGMTGQFLTKGVSGLTWTNNTLTASQVSAALGYTPASATTALTSAAITSALGYTAASASALSNYAVKNNNLSDLASATVARSNLGLGALATKNSVNLSTADVTGTLPAANLPAFSGDVSSTAGSSTVTVNRIRGITVAATAPVSGQVLSYNGTQWTPVSTANGSVSNINTGTGLTGGPITTTGTIAVNFGTVSGTVAQGNDSRILGALQAVNNLSEISSASMARTNLGLGTFATANSVDLGTASATGIIADARLANQANVTSGTQYTKVTVDGKGRVVSGAQLSAADINTALGFAPASATALSNYAIKNNNLSDLTSATLARNNLGLGALATKSIVSLTSDVSGVLPVASGGSKWSANLGSIYTVSNTTIGSSTAFTNVGLYAVAPVAVSSSIAASINNTNSDGFGLKINVDNTSPLHYGLRVTANNLTNFVILNSGNVGIGTAAPTARLQIASGTGSLAPIKLTGGNLLSTPVSGSIEFDGMQLYLTDQTNTRRIIASQPSLGVMDYTTTISNSSNITLNPNAGAVIVSSAAISTGFNSGALVVKGGLGVNGNGNFNGQLNATGNINTNGNINTSGTINASGSIVTNMNVIAGSVIAPFMYGGTTSGVTLAIDSTSHANKGNIAIAANGGNVGVGTVSPSYRFQVKSSGINVNTSVFSASTGIAMIGTGEDNTNQVYNIGYDTTGTSRWFFTTAGTNYFNSSLVVGNTSEITGNKLSVHGNTYITGNATVSNTLFLVGATSAIVPMRFTSSVLATTPVSGGFEFDGNNLLFTNNAAARRTLASGPDANTIDKISVYKNTTSNLIFEGTAAGTTPGITIKNIGAGTVALLVDKNTVVSGSIKLSVDGLDSATACTAAEEGKQRYNKTYKTMEYCDGAYWQGMSGITHCYSAGVSYTLVGIPGTGSAFCMSKNSESATTYVNAVTTCQNRTTTRNNARPYLCSEVNYQMACRQYTTFNTQAETFLPGFRSTYYWIPAAYDGTNMFVLRYTTATAGVCNVSDMGNTNVSEASNQSYRCCYN